VADFIVAMESMWRRFDVHAVLFGNFGSRCPSRSSLSRSSDARQRERCRQNAVVAAHSALARSALEAYDGIIDAEQGRIGTEMQCDPVPGVGSAWLAWPEAALVLPAARGVRGARPLRLPHRKISRTARKVCD
jgi:hypothetical protein